MSSDRWYVSVREKIHGPYQRFEIEKFLAEQRIHNHTLVSVDGRKFYPLSDVFHSVPSESNLAITATREWPENDKAIMGQVGDRVAAVAGVDKLEGFHLKDVLSDVFRKHDQREIEEKFAVGCGPTTPDILQVDANWPKPWVFFRALGACLIAYFVLIAAIRMYENPRFIPAIIFVGTFAVPLATLIFFFESNVLKNVSLYQIVRAFLIGGILSLVIALPFYSIADVFSLNWMGASVAGLVEEPAKLCAVLLAVKISRFPYILNGLLFGAAVGTGFAAFESAGYAFTYLGKGFDDMLKVINIRGVLAPFMHIPWTAAYCAAFWAVCSKDRFSWSDLVQPFFLRVFATSVVLHILWNSPFELPFFLKYVCLGFVAWIVVFSMLQSGLKEIRREKGEKTKLYRP